MIKIYAASSSKPFLKGGIRDLRPTWLLLELDLPFERIPLDGKKGENKTPEYLALNPTGKVPTMIDGNLVLFESHAICEYIAEKSMRYIPRIGTEEYYKCRQWNYWFATNLEPLFGRVFAADFTLQPGPTTDEIRQSSLEAMPRFLNVLNEHLSRQSYMLGDAFMVTDIFPICTFFILRHREILKDYPYLQRYFEICTGRPAFQNALALNGS